jgi:DNA-binding transcriptional ArsR family regulator
MNTSVTPEQFEEIQLNAERQAGYCRVLGNPERVLILWLLMEKEMTAKEIALVIKASHPSTFRHLNILGFNKLVESRQLQQSVFYRLADNEQTRECLILKNKPKTILNAPNHIEKEKSNVRD